MNKKYSQCAIKPAEQEENGHHNLPVRIMRDRLWQNCQRPVYDYSDLLNLQELPHPQAGIYTGLNSLDELIERDILRERDGFPRKIRIGKLVKPGMEEKDKFILVPTTVEEKLIHDEVVINRKSGFDEGDHMGGCGEGDVADLIGMEPVNHTESESNDSGNGNDGNHEIESNAYDLGRILTDKFELPNLQGKGKKKSLTKHVYDLTDRQRGTGQFLDKKATLKKIIETNAHLGNIPDVGSIDPTSFIISPNDKIYRIMSKEKDLESQAVAFFIRDYSGSMAGKPTDLIVSQHVMIYGWLLYQYHRRIITRFILHDTRAREVSNFYTYYNSTVAGGTKVASAYQMVNTIVERENLAQDYNIYIFHGTDGDDGDKDGRDTIPEIRKMLKYSSRIGITIAEAANRSNGSTIMEKYLQQSQLLDEWNNTIRLDSMKENEGENRIIEGIKKLIS